MTKSINLRSKLRGVATKAAAVVTTAMVAAPAFAGDLATAASEGMDKAELYLIGAAVLTLCGVVVLIKKGQRASGG
ncbi:MAG: hypothetical protein ACN6RH_07380 [Stenotrophomonas rhizophila]|uniref:hypothetical protein n=1 Tax=Stenotrophomonas rhizophila TaxID=216778 RepID=UPI002A6A6CD3|nr:hypothetical protein [Stenotrophomonas rhizophila]MDY0955684.1 hypothetical protein [Stenotrophomonas rhizophila]